MAVHEGRRTWMCMRCAREHLRLIEARHDLHSWAAAMRSSAIVHRQEGAAAGISVAR